MQKEVKVTMSFKGQFSLQGAVFHSYYTLASENLNELGQMVTTFVFFSVMDKSGHMLT